MLPSRCHSRKRRWAPLIVAVLAMHGFGLVSAQPAEGQLRIAFVDMERVTAASPQIARGNARLTEEFRPRNEALEEGTSRLEGLEERLRLESAFMAEQQVQALERDARALRRQLQRDREDIFEEFNFRVNEVRLQVEEEIEEIVTRFGRERGYDLILISEVLFYSDRIDITDDVIATLNAESEP